jgi:anthranilate synthase/aminodeoxychorismate synthase-like glutamine amidotransferase
VWVLIDNYDSFTHILHHYLLQTGAECRVYRNDALTIQELEDLRPERLILSPGPGTPLQAGITLAALRHFYQQIPVLGVCLGHQALGMHFGAQLVHAPLPVHGKPSVIHLEEHPLFEGLNGQSTVMRYHSLVLEQLEHTGLRVIARAEDDQTIQAICHREWPCIGVQFHPESVGTPDGFRMIANWASMQF